MKKKKRNSILLRIGMIRKADKDTVGDPYLGWGKIMDILVLRTRSD